MLTLKVKNFIILQSLVVFVLLSSCKISPTPTTTTSDNSKNSQRIFQLISNVEKNFTQEIAEAEKKYRLNARNEDIIKIKDSFNNLIALVKENNQRKSSYPFAKIVTSKNIKLPNNDSRDRPLKIGYFPVAGDPIHWGHLLTALQILAEENLDKVVFLSGGYDKRKPNLTHPDIRHPMIKDAIGIFGDFFAFSDISVLEGHNNEEKPQELSYNGTINGETNMFHDLRRNTDIAIDAYYIVGSDHFNWTKKNAQGVETDDTLKVLTENRTKRNLAFNAKNHKIKVVFINRDSNGVDPEKIKEMRKLTDLEIFFKENLLEISSTKIRNGFGELKTLKSKDIFVYIPIRTYQTVVTKKLYQNK